jgi:hypothetical protein
LWIRQVSACTGFETALESVWESGKEERNKEIKNRKETDKYTEQVGGRYM